MNARTATAGRRAEEPTQAAMDAAADAMRDAAATASDHVEKLRATIADAGPQAMQSASRVAYTTSYMLAYGIVYAAVFVAKSLPRDNPVMHGFYDGGVAARDELG